MVLTYAVGGSTAALTVIGLCEYLDTLCRCTLLIAVDMLFNNEGEAFNVRRSLIFHRLNH